MADNHRQRIISNVAQDTHEARCICGAVSTATSEEGAIAAARLHQEYAKMAAAK